MRSVRVVVVTGFMVAIAGCSVQKPPKVPDEIKVFYPSNVPKGTITNFNAALACMDDLMLLHAVAPVYVASQGILNYTSDQSLSAGGIEMLVTALSKMSIRSNGVRFVSYNSDISNMLTLQGAHPNNADFRVPDFFIRGGVTQFNKSLWSGQRGHGASFQITDPDIIDGGTFFHLRGQEDLSGSNSHSASYGTVTLDMSAGFISTLQIVPGVASTNTLALESQSGKATSIDLTVADVGYTFSFSQNMSYDFNTVFRSLIEVGAIEIVGKLQKVPYWRCLAQAGEVEERDRQLAKQWQHLSKFDQIELVKGVQRALGHLSYYEGPADGKVDDTTREAVQDYQQRMGLIASGDVDFQTFRMLNLFTPTKEKTASNWWLPFPDAQPVRTTGSPSGATSESGPNSEEAGTTLSSQATPSSGQPNGTTGTEAPSQGGGPAS